MNKTKLYLASLLTLAIAAFGIQYVFAGSTESTPVVEESSYVSPFDKLLPCGGNAVDVTAAYSCDTEKSTSAKESSCSDWLKAHCDKMTKSSCETKKSSCGSKGESTESEAVEEVEVPALGFE